MDSEARPLASHSVVQNINDSYDRIDRVLDYLHMNYEKTVGLNELSELAAMSQSGLHRLFKKHVGVTVSSYIINLRIGEACARLAASDVAISVISQDVGYQSQANFNRHFLRLRSMTPRAYRKKYRSN